MSDTALTADELAALNPEPGVKDDGTVLPSTSSLDPERTWLTVTCPNGHTCVVEAHQGGSTGHCDQCDARFPYGQPDVAISDGDSGAAGDGTS